jgi:hypothetical protein
MLPPSSLHPECGGSMGLWNVGILPQHYTASQSRRPRLETSAPWKPPNWNAYNLFGYIRSYGSASQFLVIVLFGIWWWRLMVILWRSLFILVGLTLIVAAWHAKCYVVKSFEVLFQNYSLHLSAVSIAIQIASTDVFSWIMYFRFSGYCGIL